MAAGVTNKLWSVADLVALHDAWLDRQNGPVDYKWEPFGPVLGHGR
jgi:hypothetical protein